MQGLEQHPYNQQQFVDSWTNLWSMVACLPNFKSDLANRVFVDVMNEPDSMGIKWEAANGRPGAHQLYLGTADALWQVTPDEVLFMFEGEWHLAPSSPRLQQLISASSPTLANVYRACAFWPMCMQATNSQTLACKRLMPLACLAAGTGQQALGLNWGNGFVTDQDVISSRGLADANPFFLDLMSRPYVGKAGNWHKDGCLYISFGLRHSNGAACPSPTAIPDC